MRSATAIALLLVGFQAANAGNILEGANKVEFSLLCDLVALAEADLTLPPITDTTAEALEDMLRLNMSVSDSAWQKMFKKQTGENDYHETMPDGTNDPGGWAAMWPQWSKAIKALKVDKKEEDLKQAGIQELTAEEAKSLRTHLRPILAKVLKIEKARGNLQPALAKLDAKTVKTELQKAVFGAAGKTKTDVQHTDVFETSSCSTYSACCEITPTSPKAKAAAAVLACLCAKADSSPVDGVCGFSTGPGTQWTVAGAPAATAVREPLAFCPSTSDTTITASRLERIVTGLKNQMKIISTVGYLGEFKSGTCGGQETNGLCVKYTGYTGKVGKAFEDIPWVKTVSTLVSDLTQREQAAAQASFLAAQLLAEKDAAYSLAELAKQTTNLVKVTSDGKGTNNSQQSKDCKTHTDNKTCTDNGCKWKGKSETDGPCVVDESKVKEQTNTAAGTGDGAAKPGVNCSSHTTKEACEGVTGTPAPGKKAVCGWIDDKCQNSTFLLTKKFALTVVSAAFVALLF
uniref:Variant surface glycoprotein (VSG), putative n=1 Tax=Trypanosoma brucei brucei (strain 927/4 GUTat10.1) TaxID=185431 RepID=Q4FKM4_TRYB2|nr:variant surface glycoprotein (VSG), putative [Trypanosoma brucei brucei TREU927]